MPDWDRYRKTFLLGDFSAQNLERLRTMRAWADLSPEECGAAAEQHFAGMDADTLRPWYQLSRGLSLKLANTAEIAAIDQIRSIIARLQPESTQLSPGMLAGNATWQEINPLSAAAMTVNVSPAYVNDAGLQKLKGLLGGLLQIGNKAAPDNTYRPTAFYFAAEAARALGDGNANRGDSAEAMEWYAKSGEYFDLANEPDKASQSRQKAAALELQVTGDIDRVMQRILGSLFDPAHPPEPLDAAMAYADLSQVMQQAHDGYGAGQQAARAAAAFEKLGFRDPETGDADIALDSWVSRSCDLASGKPVFALLMRVCQAYNAVYSGRISQFSISAPERALKAQQLAAGMTAIVSQIVAETKAAEESVKVAIDDYFPTIAAPDPAMSANSPADKELQMTQVDEALMQLKEVAGVKGDAGEPVQPVLAMFEQLKPLADALEMPLYSAKWQIAYCYAQIAAGDKEAALKAAEDAVSILLRGKDAKLRSLVQVERRPYLEALLWKMRLQFTLGRLQEGLATCLETIADFEESRGKVNAPLQQSSALESAIEFYRGAAFAAFKMQEWDLLLYVTELVKARSALRSRYSTASTDPQFQTLAKQFDQLTAALQSTADSAALDDIKARRRDVFDLMTIARLRNSSSQSAPPVSVAALQQALQPDEAVLNYFYLNSTVFVIVRLDRERCEVERVLSSDEELAPVNDLLDAIEGLDASGPLDLDSAIAEAGNILLTPGVRQFLEGKKRVIISPHHRLHLFPFHAATWDGKFLIERCAVRYVPNLSSLLLDWVAQTGQGQTNKDVFALGVGQFSVARQNWGELKNTEEQVRAVHDLYASAGRSAITLTGAAASVEAFRALASSGRLGKCSALHLATHGTSVFSSEAQNEPMESTLVLEDGCIDGLEIATLSLPAEIAVLSACNSGQRAVAGRGLAELPGDEIFGLQAALFQAGVHTVLGTLWPVETNAAYALTLKFHERYVRGDSVEIALQKAMVGVCEASGRAGTFLWAPFFLSSLGTMRTAASS